MKKVVVALSFILSVLTTLAQHDHNFRVVGYVMDQNISKLTQRELGMITHLCVAFINPDANGEPIFGPYVGNGNVTPSEIPLSAAVAKAKKYGVKTSISLAGGGSLWGDKLMINRYKTLMNDENRPKFVNSLVKFIADNDLHGIDIDIEGDVINEYLGDLMKDLSDTCHKRGWEVTAAWPALGMWADKVNEKALANVDHLYIMSYDNKGPWNPSDPGQHAPYNKSIMDIEYYKKRGVNDTSIVLGLPFYGHDFTTDPVVTRIYPDIVGMDKEASQKDQVGKLWYNGQPMMQKKTKMAIEKNTGGVMIWEITQDVSGKQSLLNSIYTAALPALCSDHSIMVSTTEKVVMLSNLPSEEILSITVLKDNDVFQKAFSSKQIKNENGEIKLNLKKPTGKTLVLRTKINHYKINLK